MKTNFLYYLSVISLLIGAIYSIVVFTYIGIFFLGMGIGGSTANLVYNEIITELYKMMKK